MGNKSCYAINLILCRPSKKKKIVVVYSKPFTGNSLILLNNWICIVRKIEKKKICPLSCSPYPTMFSKAFCCRVVNPLPENSILDWSKLKRIADDIR